MATSLEIPAGGPPPVVVRGTRTESPTRRALRRFRRHRLAMISVIFLLLVVILAVGAPVFGRYNPDAIRLSATSRPPSLEHWLGTDRVGRDVWSRTIYAGRVSLLLGLAATVLTLAIGIVIGGLSGFYGGVVDMLLQRFTDIVMAFPSIVLMLTLAVFIGPGLGNLILIIGGVSWTGVARLVRAEFLAARERTYVDAARCIGVPGLRIVFRHILPNSLAPVIAQAAFSVGLAILTEAGLSFLGLGVPLPTSTWGNMLEAARELDTLSRMPWQWMPPAFMIVLTVLCVNFIGDGLRDALDPRTLLQAGRG
ncbi:MAG TPA: oligopeptide ABC transporter permease [Anaerolineae bacterium]